MKKKFLSVVLAAALIVMDCAPALAEEISGAVASDSAIHVTEEAGTAIDEDEVFAVCLPEGFELSENQLEIKEDGLEDGHKASSLLNSAIEGTDYVANEVFFAAESEENAKTVADAIGATLTDYNHGYATLELSDEMSVADAVALSEDESKGLPLLEPNWYASVDPVEEDECVYAEDVDALGAADYVTPTNWNDYGSGDPYLTPDEITYQWFHEMISDYAAWGIARGKGIKIGVIDSGIYDEHEDFSGRIGSSEVISGSVALDSSAGAHGTNVAGIIAENLGNGIGGAGVAPEATLYSYKIFAGSTDSDNVTQGTTLQTILAVSYAMDDGMNVLNMSFGSAYYSSTENAAIQSAIKKGIVVVAAAGNEGEPFSLYPSSYSNVISVSAVNEDGSRAAFSNYGSGVTVSAPGVDMWATANTNNTSFISCNNLTGDVYYDFMSGTSQATPVVTGAVALYLSVAGNMNGDVNADGKRDEKDVKAVTAALKKCCTKSDNLCSGMGAGIINCYNLVAPFGGIEDKTKESQPEITVVETAEPASKVVIEGSKSYGTVTDKKGVLKSIQLFTVDLNGTDYDADEDESESTVSLSAKVYGKSGNEVTCPVVWTSSNSKIASVSSSGLVTAKKAGKVTISAITADGTKKKAKVTINVVVPASSLLIGTKDAISESTESTSDSDLYTGADHLEGAIEIAIGKSKKLNARLGGLYGTPTVKKVTWALPSTVTENYGITIKNGTLKVPAGEGLSTLLEENKYLTLSVYAYATDGSGCVGKRTIRITKAPTVFNAVPSGNGVLTITSESTGGTMTIGNPGKDAEGKDWYALTGKTYYLYFYSDSKYLNLSATGQKDKVYTSTVPAYTGYYFTKNNKTYYVYAVKTTMVMPTGSGSKVQKTDCTVKLSVNDGSKKSASVKFSQYSKSPN